MISFDAGGRPALTEAEGETLVRRLAANLPTERQAALERIVGFFSDETGAAAVGAGPRYRALHRFFYERPWLAVADRLRFAGEVLEFTDGVGKHALEVGAGFGITSVFLALGGAASVVSQDIGIESVTHFARWLKHLDLGALSVRLCVGDASGLSFPDDCFDVCTADGMLSHVSDLEGTLTEIRRVLKPGGRLLIQDENNALVLEGRIRRRRGKWARSEKRYREVRRQALREVLPAASEADVNTLVHRTRSLTAGDIQALAEGRPLPKPVTHAPRDPITGVYAEREMSPFWLCRLLRKHGFAARLVPVFVPHACARPDSALLGALKLRLKGALSRWPALAALAIDSLRIVAVAEG